MEPLDTAKGCTVGLIHVPGGMLFFKNRDLEEKYHTHRITVWQSTPEVHVLQGANLKTGELEGVAIGVNRHGICVANTHVASTPDVTYDLLCEELVRDAREQADVPAIVQAFVERHPVQGGRILVACPTWALLVEVYQRQFAIQEVAGNVALTNTFSLIQHRPERPDADERSSANRLEVASRLLETSSGVGALKSMLRSHIPEKGHTSICNHRTGGGGTESSHIIQIVGDQVTWSSLVGYPCENDYQSLLLFQA
jgi:hypothetical protein